MSMDEKAAPTSVENIERCIFLIRGHKVMLDFHLAVLYGVETKNLNKAVKRNSDRFPADFAFQLAAEELTNLKCQIGTSSFSHGGRRKPVWAFTEQGVAPPEQPRKELGFHIKEAAVPYRLKSKPVNNAKSNLNDTMVPPGAARRVAPSTAGLGRGI